jgi:hypothetical protein
MLIQIVANSHNKVKFYVIAAGFEKGWLCVMSDFQVFSYIKKCLLNNMYTVFSQIFPNVSKILLIYQQNC